MLAINKTGEKFENDNISISDDELKIFKGMEKVFLSAEKAGKMSQLKNSSISQFLPILSNFHNEINKQRNEEDCHSTVKSLITRCIASLRKRIGLEAENIDINDDFISTDIYHKKCMKVSPEMKELFWNSMMLNTAFKENFIAGNYMWKPKASTVDQLKTVLINRLKLIIKRNKERNQVDSEQAPKKKPKISQTDYESYWVTGNKDETLDDEHAEVKFLKLFFVTPHSNQDPVMNISYWILQKHSYPCCFELVCSFLTIPCSSIWNEQMFSQVDNILTNKRQNIKEETLNHLFWYKINAQRVLYK